MRPFIKAGTLIVLLAVSGGIALAQFSKPEDAIVYRKSVMQVIKKHFGSMAAAIKGQAPFDKTAFTQDAEVVALMAKLPWEAFFVPGSAQGNTDLKEKALQDAAGFRAVAKGFEEASRKLAAAAASGDQGAIKKRFGATAQTCGGCHKPYKK